MSKTLTEIAKQLKDNDKKVQLIYAFNSTGKTRLSREFKQLIAPKNDDEAEQTELSRTKILYYNAFTEDLFYWDNDLEADNEPKLKIQPNSFINWIFENQGLDRKIIDNFQSFTGTKVEPQFDITQGSITFKIIGAFSSGFSTGFNTTSSNVKISKGEESNFIWSIFYTLLQAVIDTLKEGNDDFKALKYVFIDDPVSSLDENHLIQLAVDLAQLIKSSKSTTLKFIVTTHNPLFYNVLWNEFREIKDDFQKYTLKKHENMMYELYKQKDDSPFSYHLQLKQEIENAIKTGNIHKYHFNFLRNILEKMATFLGYHYWGKLLPLNDDGKLNPYEKRLIDICSHSKHSSEEIKEVSDDNKRVLKYLMEHLDNKYHFHQDATSFKPPKTPCKQLIEQINLLHLAFSKDYFESGNIESINLSRTIAHVPVTHIYKYRLTLHESINDYLMRANIDIRYFYRVKTRESIDDKINRFANREDQYPVNNWLNDIFGARIVLTATEITNIMDLLDDWQETFGLENWHLRNQQGYKGLHIYFKNKNNFFFPWELQIWDSADLENNIKNHEKFKRHFV